VRSLDRLPAGTHAIIHEVVDVDDTLLRLLEMGMTPSTPLVVTRRALFGDPLEVEVRGTRLCLRRSHAKRFRMRAPDAP
jgi:ferrous iron transport protein A